MRLVGLERSTDGGIVIDVLRHLVEHARKSHQRDEGGVEPGLLRSIIEAEPWALFAFTQLLASITCCRVTRGGTDLGKQGVQMQR